MADLGQAYIAIIPSFDGTKKAIAKELGDVEKEFNKKGSSSGNGFSDGLAEGLKKVTKIVGAAAVAAASAAAVGVGAVVKQSVLQYAEFEQQVGGVQTMFKESSGTMLKYAQDAYKTAGVSANSFMAQATSFSATLLQGLKGDTKAAAEYANKAMIDMSDNANKFGTNIGSIQGAYQGFAKQNYMMLDNLKLGYGGTKKEMQRLLEDASKLPGALGKKFDITNFSDVIEAIHLVQQNLGITGTTAKEATETIQGSLGMMSAAWSNMLANLGAGANQGTIGVKAMASNVIESLGYVIDNIGSATARIAGRLPALGVEIYNGFKTTIAPKLLEAGRNVITSFITGMETTFPQASRIIANAKELFTPLINQARNVGAQLAPIFSNLGQQIGSTSVSAFTGFINVLTKVLPIVGNVVNNTTSLVTTILKIPTPILAGVAAFTAFHTIAAKLPAGLGSLDTGIAKAVTGFLKMETGSNATAGAVKKLGSSFSEHLSDLAAIGARSLKAGQNYETMSQSALVARGAVTLLGAAMKTALINAGITVAIMAVTAAIGYLVSKIGEAKRVQAAWESDVKSLAKTMRDANGELSKQQWADHWATELDKASKAGHNAEKATQTLGISWANTLAVLESGDLSKQTAMVDGWKKKLETAKQELTAMQAPALASAMAIGKTGEYALGAGSQLVDFSKGTQQYTMAVQGNAIADAAATNAKKAEVQAYEDLLDAIDPNIRKIQEAEAAMYAQMTATERYQLAVDQLTASLDKAKAAQDRLNGAAVSEQEAQNRYTEAIWRGEDALKKYNDAVNKSGAESREAQQAKIDLDRADRNLSEAAQGLGEAVLFSGKSLAEAAEATKEGITMLDEHGKAVVRDEAQMKSLNNTALDYTKGAKDLVNTTLELNEAEKKSADALAKAIQAKKDDAKAMADQASAAGDDLSATEIMTKGVAASTLELFKQYQQSGLSAKALADAANKAGVLRDDFVKLGEKAGYSTEELNKVKNAVNAVPVAHNTNMTQTGKTAADWKFYEQTINGVPTSHNTNATHTGKQPVDWRTYATSISSVPTSQNTNATHTGTQVADWVKYSSSISNVPGSRNTFLSQSGVGVSHFQGITTSINNIPSSKTTTIFASGADAGHFNNIAQAINNIPTSKNITINYSESGHINGNMVAKADGGIVQRYANGGLLKKFAVGGYNTAPRVPQIVKGGANILWGEPETGWEAYISGKPSMRRRNLEILDEVAKRFGQQLIPAANGAMRGPDAYRPASRPTEQPRAGHQITINTQVADTRQVMRAMAMADLKARYA